jgi:hypothetical protein
MDGVRAFCSWRGGKVNRVIAGIAITVVLGGALARVLLGPSSGQAQLSRAVSAMHCPAGAKGLPAAAVARAADRALVEAPQLYPGLGAAMVTQSALARYADGRGSEVRHQCGRRAFDRTVVVQLLFPKELPSASLSQGVVFVSRFATGYRVWKMAH